MKQKVLQLIERTYKEITRYSDALDDRERQSSGTLEEWSPKDTLGHIAGWAQRTAAALDGETAAQTAGGDDGNEDSENAAIYHSIQPMSWDEVQAALNAAFMRLAGQVNEMSEADLLETGRQERQRGRPTWRVVLGNGCIHPLVHLGYAYLQRGDADQAMRLAEETSQALMALDSSPAWQGETLYNLACSYSMLGERVKALAYLTQALHMQPALVEFSKTDADLAALRDDPEYLALVQQS